MDEGLLKGATTVALRQAAQGRLQVLRRARELLQERGYPDGADRGQGLVISTALTLESGLSEPVLTSALDRGRRAPPGQVKAVVEAGESLYLAGLDAATVGTVMTDCLERNLRRPEVLRVVRLAREKMAAGLRGPAGATPSGGLGGLRGRRAPGSAPSGPGEVRGRRRKWARRRRRRLPGRRGGAAPGRASVTAWRLARRTLLGVLELSPPRPPGPRRKSSSPPPSRRRPGTSRTEPSNRRGTARPSTAWRRASS